MADTVRWLHEEGLSRLAGLSDQVPGVIAAYTIDVAAGTVTAYPAAGSAGSAGVLAYAADDLPFPDGSTRRLVVVGVTTTNSVLVVDLATTLALTINSDRPESPARSWVLQLLLNPEITITTNSAEVALEAGNRCRHTFIPGGGGTIVSVDDTRPPVTTITLNSSADGPDHLDVEIDRSGEMYLGTRCWTLDEVMTVDDNVWAALAAQLEESIA
ncbi:hypothetical protein D5S18_00855 [Nocardia panacis]|uniref:Uncharacterized protein n=1 Tax=Nocardia panacis TaxID=2340916 RepID=A0A3A4K4F6_9NOCA|nr:hypothetical protein D5S18_00855 [Nocardia panacis]